MAIISFKHDFIFIKTRKTAGTSIEIDLSPVAGADAVVTPIQPPAPGHVPRNYLDDDGQPLFFNHMAAREIRQKLGQRRFSAMTRFCVEREPVEKCISHFHMLCNSPLHNPDGSYHRDWQRYCEEGRFPIDVNHYSARTPEGRVLLVDHILRYDRLERDLPALMARLGLPGFRLRHRAKSEFSRNRLVRPEDVTSAQRAIIHDRFRESLDVSGISWDIAA